MTSHMGRYRKVFSLVATGNGNGLVGYSLANAVEGKAAMRKARNRAGQKLMYIPRHEDRTSEKKDQISVTIQRKFPSSQRI